MGSTCQWVSCLRGSLRSRHVRPSIGSLCLRGIYPTLCELPCHGNLLELVSSRFSNIMLLSFQDKSIIIPQGDTKDVKMIIFGHCEILRGTFIFAADQLVKLYL